MAKPRIFKDKSWSVELPTFGFGPAVLVKDGFPTWKAAGDWLATKREVGTGSQLVERAPAVRRGSWGYDNWPVVIR